LEYPVDKGEIHALKLIPLGIGDIGREQIGVKRRTAHHGQNGSIFRVDRHHGTFAIAEGGLCCPLHIQVDREMHIMPCSGGLLSQNSEHPTHAVNFNLLPAADPRPASFNPGANDAAPGKRPRSSMAPTILFAVDEAGREWPVAAYGSPGGATIINTVFTMTLNLIDHRMAVQTAIDAPRLSLTSAADGATAAIEPGFDAGVLARLTALGYRFAEPALIGSVQAVVIDPATGAQYGGADGRRRGTVIGLPHPATP